MKRRTLLAGIGSLFPIWSHIQAETVPPADPWTKAELMEPSTLAALLTSGKSPEIISVAFPFLYRQRHIAGARFAGPGSKPEGITALKEAAAKLPNNTSLVIYCGCCPMVHCPNIRPAYQTLKQLGFTNIRVLNLPTNFHSDWTAKGYPVEPPLNSAA